MVDQQTAVGTRQGAEPVGVGMLGIVASHAPEIVVGAYHGPRIAPLPLGQEQKESQRVGQAAQQQHLASAPAR